MVGVGGDTLTTGRGFAQLSRSASLVAVVGCYLLAAAGAGVALLRFRGHETITSALVADVAATLVVFGLSTVVSNASVYDPYWSVVPPVVALALVLGSTEPGALAVRVRQVTVVLLVLAWGVRLTANWAAGWQGMGHEDWRYRHLRERTAGRVPFWVVNLVGIQLVPTLVVLVAMLPLWPALAEPARGLGPLDLVALLVTAGSIALETAADRRRRDFAADPGNRGRTLATGVWRWSRHPNYLGEIGFWCGLWLFGVAASPRWWWTVVGPLVMVLLFLAASIPLMEERSLARRPGYAQLVADVPRLLPVRRPLAAVGWLLVLAGWAVLVRVIALGGQPWRVAASVAIVWGALVIRGRALGRPRTMPGLLLGLPSPPPPPASAAERERVRALLDRTEGDPLAPFAQRRDRSLTFSDDGAAAVSYRVRFGTAVAAGDPVGRPESAGAAVTAFLRVAGQHGWRVAGLGTSQPALWAPQGLRAVPIGRDVVIDVGLFSLVGRRFRNLRQAAQRARNAGVEVELVAEQGLDPDERAALRTFAASVKSPRGFSMILDHPLDGEHHGTLLAVARDTGGEVVAVVRFATAGAGRDLSLDVPWRSPSAPNGTEELLTLSVVEWARQRGGRSVSLAFAPFPELLGRPRKGPSDLAARAGVQLLRPFIDLDGLQRYLRKYHALGGQRFVVLRPAEVLWVLAAMLTLEFGRNR